MGAAAQVADIIPADWEMSLKHLVDNVDFRFGAIADELSRVRDENHRLAQRVTQLEVLEVQRT